MLSAAHNSCCLPHVSVSVYGTGPGFLLLLFSCRSAGQETVNTHSAAPTHKSEQRAALYIQIRDGGGRRGGGKKKKMREPGDSVVKPQTQAACPATLQDVPARDESEMFTLLPNLPSLHTNHYKKHFITFGAKKLNTRLLWLSLLQIFVGLFPTLPPPAPPNFISCTSEAFKGTVPLLLLLSSKVLE